MKINYNRNIVSQSDDQLNSVLVSNRSMTENSLRMRAMAYLAQVKANLLTDTIYELNEDKKIVSKYAKSLKNKNLLLEEQKKIIEEQNKKLVEQIELEKRHEVVKRQAQELEKINRELQESQSLAHIGSWSFIYEKEELLSFSNEIYNILQIDKELKKISYKDVVNSFYQKDLSLISEQIEKSIKDESSYEFENRLLMKDGKIKYIRQKGFSIYDSENEVFLTHGIIQDISEYKKLERLRLEKEKQLMSQTKLAAMGEMIGNIAHQWRQPLNAITVATSGMQIKYSMDELSKEEFDMFSKGIIKNAEFLSKTIDTFTNYIKEEKEYKNLILQDEIDQALNICSNSFKNHFITLTNNIDYNKSVELRLVSGELAEVLINILNNAKDVLVEKDINNPEIKISLDTIEDKKVIISIEDNGGGIKDDVLPHIFEPYFTTKHQYKGTGIGLYMSHKIITESLHGKIYANNINNGVRFTIELPL